MVLRKLYTLEEDRSGRDLDDSQPLTSSLRRGMKINMAMVFVTPMYYLVVAPAASWKLTCQRVLRSNGNYCP